MSTFASYHYQPGGSLTPDAPSYVMRQADHDLFEALLHGTYCYILNSRQMGKSSLRVRTMERLAERGFLTVEIELLGIGSQHITASQWYGGIIAELISGLELQVNRRAWLKEHEDLSPVQQLSTFVEHIVLTQIKQPLVLFFDEIDSVLGLSFPTDDFFGLVRSWYERRSLQPNYRRLTVVMLGVATPSALIQDETSTPFNIGRAIQLQGFQPHESGALASGLVPYADCPDAVLHSILDWTGGQPFLTQKLCWLVTQQHRIASGEEAQRIAELVRSQLIENWETQDEPEHLRTIRDRILRHPRKPEHLLRYYQTILQRGSVPATNSPEQTELRLTGLVTQRQGRLVPFNRVYTTIFDRAWVAQQLQTLRRKSLQAVSHIPMWQGIAAGVSCALVVLLVRSLGLLQGLELQAYDRMMQWRPVEPVDERFLIITVSEADIQYQDQLGMERKGSLADQALLQLLNVLTPYQPRGIGLDFYHDFPLRPDLETKLRETNGFIPVCGIAETLDVETPISIPAPPGLPTNALGFTDVAVDSDYTVRRQLLGMDRSEACPTSYSFNLQVALLYLEREGINLEFLDASHIRLGRTIIPKLSSTAGGYQLPPAEQAGFQTLVNYRTTDPPRVSLMQILRGDLNADLAKLVNDRMILIGLENPKDALFVPGRLQRMPGVVMHAHMAGQLIDAGLGDRPLMWWWPEWLEMLWIGSWALVGSGVVWWLCGINQRSRWMIGVAVGGMVIAVSGISYGVLLTSGWIPVVPSVMAIAIAAGAVLVLTSRVI